jgi:RNA polymerase sigma-70 factor, ECF subfamily
VLYDVWARSARSAIAPRNEDESLDGVFGALRGLSRPVQEALVAVDVVGLSYREAARALGTSETTIIDRLYRGRDQIAHGCRDVSAPRLEFSTETRG